ncbi:hypothetical protein COEREDRAFT_12106 [Coemansia reversa NRRL 1564]|uniref:Uncharacterized protein n=1 Tax=Coemansia reversa (strain ATCC 12441 / NRRL 1564) TaxID=763665 RepID=A0A2G5B1H2_COERN|nr:hypothetical protein COEREDRAFT_12106 [Coemansia reversa NRRL 1564]|eukprot:PIA12859.1 hypothetical protein COEREDRAFT_12106 [Coemansia reversa NRRL 1564]
MVNAEVIFGTTSLAQQRQTRPRMKDESGLAQKVKPSSIAKPAAPNTPPHSSRVPHISLNITP